MHVRFVYPVALSCLILLCAPQVAAPAERAAIYPGTPGPEIDSHILFETVFPLNELLPSRWTAAQRKEVAYILERMKKDNRIFILLQVAIDPIGRKEDNERMGMEISQAIADRLRESGIRRDRILVVPAAVDVRLFDEPRWGGFAGRQKAVIRGLRGGPWLQVRETPVTFREELPPEGVIRIIDPVEEKTDHARHVLRGTAAEGVRTVSISVGQETKTATVYQDGFEAPVSLQAGVNHIVVTGLDPYGRALRASREILYTPPKPSIVLTSPPAGSVVDITRSPVVAVRGKIRSRNPLATAYLIQNDIPLRLRIGEDGSFEQPAALITDEDVFTVEAQDLEGRTGVSEQRKVGARGIAERPLMAILYWDEDDIDIDLHIVDAKEFHTYFDAPDIYESATAIQEGKLLLDNRKGFGPEVFTIDRNVPGVFTFSAEYYRGKKACRVYLTVVLFAGSPSRKIVRVFGPIVLSPAKRTARLVQVSLPGGNIVELPH
ncbi:MAG: hypothetical protein M0Z38_12085 [Deltaproteobacteria bacterium]|nr:hypothetical protein [Deltaproteobacteria bacterium]